MANLNYLFGVQAVLYLFVHLISLVVTWWAIQSFKFDLFIKNPQGARAKVLQIFITIAISSLVADFFLNYLNSSLRLPQLFH